MRVENFLFLVALACILCFAQGFWLWSKPTKRPTQANVIKTPVIIVPGSGGSQLQAKLNKPKVLYWYCFQKTSYYYQLWVRITSFLPGAINCFIDNMRLVYDESTKTIKNSPGVKTRVPGFGDTDTIEYLDSNNLVKYFAPMVEALASWGYERGVTVRAAPYDFRRGPESQSEYFASLKKLIEETYSSNGNKRITLMCHSLGCPYSLIFLNNQTKEWKDKYILQWITLAGVWGGTAGPIRLYASGNTLGIPRFLVNPLTVRGMLRTYTSNIFLLPSTELWSADEVLVKTPERNYTVSNYDEFFHDVGFPLGTTLQKLVGTPNYPLTANAPNVTVYCLYGTGVKTAESFAFGEGEFPDTQPQVVYGDGDGVVNLRSLKACSRLDQRQPYNVSLQQYPSVDHNGVLSDGNVQNYIKTLLF